MCVMCLMPAPEMLVGISSAGPAGGYWPAMLILSLLLFYSCQIGEQITELPDPSLKPLILPNAVLAGASRYKHNACARLHGFPQLSTHQGFSNHIPADPPKDLKAGL